MRAYHEAEVAARVKGYVDRVEVDIGDEVKQGQALASLSVPDMKATTRRLQAELKLQRQRVRTAAAAERSARAELSARRSEETRLSRLAKTGVVTVRAAEEARARLESAEAQVDVARSEASSARALIEVTQGSLAELDAQVSFATLLAPFDGVITARAVDPGDLVGAGPEAALFTVAHLATVRLEIALPERDAALADPGDAVSFVCDAIPGRVFEGSISRLSRALDPATRTMMVEADLPNADGRLLGGMFGTATVQLDTHADALVLPAQAIRRGDGDAPLVWKVETDNTVTHVPITLGTDHGDFVELIGGLSGDERVIVGVVGRLAPGARVELVGGAP